MGKGTLLVGPKKCLADLHGKHASCEIMQIGISAKCVTVVTEAPSKEILLRRQGENSMSNAWRIGGMNPTKNVGQSPTVWVGTGPGDTGRPRAMLFF